MSGILGSAITPCPSKSRLTGYGDHSGSDTFDSLIDGDTECENTGQVDFTTEIRSGFQIHDEGTEKPPGPAEKRQRPNGTRLPSDRKSSLLAQPAQRFRPKVGFAPKQSQTVNVKHETETQRRPEQLDSNPKAQPSRRTDSAANEITASQSGYSLKKNVRRNTLYIPQGDATVPSVFMGLFSPLKKQPGTTQSQIMHDTQINSLEERMAHRQARKSLSVGARKAPLQPSRKIAQEAALRMDVAGKNGGKENIPPGTLFGIEKKTDVQTKPLIKPRISTMSSSKPNPTSHTVRSAELAPVAPKQPLPKRSVLGERQNNTKRPAASSGQNTMAKSRGPPPSASLNARASALSDHRSRPGSNPASRLHSASLKLKELNHEDDWLSHQETVITQLVNALFECSNSDLTFHDQDCLRLELLEIYHTDNFIQLYKRLQASLSCGALSIPKHALARSSRLRQDVGLRRKFLDIWIHSYDLHVLAAAAETVIGRKVCNDIDLSQKTMKAETSARCTKPIVRKLENFLCTFLLRNEDLDQSLLYANEISTEAQAKVYRRTVLRCIMLVALLDHAKQFLGPSLPRRLFVPSSPLKSSIDVLQALTRVLLPSCGDISKPLSHLGCHLSYHQHQLLEYNYQMDNIAVDLRDGIRLTRIVELLFITPSHTRRDTGDQTEVTLNTGEALSLLGDHADVPLSKHLKYPCISRAAKVFNVQLALSALESVKGSSAIVDKVRAEDIVDGYREKTIALLWALIGKRGLSGLVDWDDINTEISRLRRKALLQFGQKQVKYEAWFTGEQFSDVDQHEQPLRHWAGLLAGLKGLQINNLSTSFANGRIYESIVDEYEPYITGNQDLEANGRSASMSLEKRLGLLGCSSQFAQLVSPSSRSSHVLSPDFTLGALTFLCSRLLSSSKRARAATVLQRAWRARLKDRACVRRMMAKNLATHCAAVVQTRNEIMWAKEVIIRWWRQVKSRNLETAARPRSLHKPGHRIAGVL
ncbi:hypothetical protein N7507_008905 [Penicillium longicatenatum]|nr:hypothetical protein N7507_008905 [Penicillium longicatenatum]